MTTVSSLPHNTLLKAPNKIPIYPVKIKNSKGQEVICANPKATRVLIALMDLGAVNGGAASHWGGPAALSEAMSALHQMMFQKADWYNYYNFVNDVGHAENGIYALRAILGYGDLTLDTLKGFRSIKSKLTGHGESHLYPEGVLLSNGPLGSSVGQAQGLAMADKLAGNQRVTINIVSDGACMEGETKEAMSAIAGFAKKGKINPFIMVISDNNTKLSGRIDADSFSMQPTFASMEALGWKIITVDQGNNLEACYQGFEKAFEVVSAQSPVCIRLKTVKGFGVKSTETSSSGGHGFPIKAYSSDIHAFIQEIWGDNLPQEFISWAQELTQKPNLAKVDLAPFNGVTLEKAQGGFAKAMIEACEKGLPVVSVSSDLQGSTGVAPFHKAFPQYSFDVGIAESNMVSVGAGFAKMGYIPVVDTFSAFGVTKGNLPLIMAALSHAPVMAVFSHTGFQDAADGASHQSLTYTSALASIPNTELINVSTSEEAYELMKIAIEETYAKMKKGEHANSKIFFVGRENFPQKNAEGLKYSWATPQVLTKGDSGLIVASGSTVMKAMMAAEQLKKTGIHVTVINQAFLNHFDWTIYKDLLKTNQNKLLTVEDHQYIGGFGSLLVHKLKSEGLEFKYLGLGVKGKFGQSAYLADELYQKHQVDEVSIKDAFKRL